ncbi:MAG: hypothetical protein R3C53_16090 [Pirellulaceae bacterium]
MLHAESPMKSEASIDLTTLVVLDSSNCLMAEVDDATAMTMVALVSEDPSSWAEAMSVWPRYRTPEVCEFASSLPLEESPRETTIAAVSAAGAWVVLDLESKRVFTGGQFQEVGRDATFAIIADDESQRSPLCVHLPPWWELHEGVSVNDLRLPRQPPVNKPNVNREILYGDVFLTEIAARILQTAASDGWRTRQRGGGVGAYYPFTIAVHRDWLMTPRADLGGRKPRDLLHGAIEWSDRVTLGQRRRFEAGGPMVAAPNDWDGFATAPMGSQEMCLYFDLCREVILAGWMWVETENGVLSMREHNSALTELTQFLRIVKDSWLCSPFEGGSSPNFIVECDRRRVPRGVGVAIEGIDGVETDEHIADCDCPICQVIADGMLGIAFDTIDGYHLELDDEFAFSMQETREAWTAQQLEYAEFNAALDGKYADSPSKSVNGGAVAACSRRC